MFLEGVLCVKAFEGCNEVNSFENARLVCRLVKATLEFVFAKAL